VSGVVHFIKFNNPDGWRYWLIHFAKACGVLGKNDRLDSAPNASAISAS